MPKTDDGLPVWAKVAEKYAGVREVPGKKANPQILKWARDTELSWAYRSDEIPWCAVFVNGVLAEAGIRGTGSAMAKSFLNWGHRLETPRKWCVVVFDRPSAGPNAGHVGFFIAYNERQDQVLVFGGNQGNEVNFTWYSRKHVRGYRWHPAGDPPKPVPVPVEPPVLPVEPEPAATQGGGDPTTAAAVLKEESRIYKSADKVEKWSLKALIGGAGLGALTEVNHTLDLSLPLIGKLSGLLAIGWQLLPFAIAGLLAWAIYQALKIKQARVEDHLTGKTKAENKHAGLSPETAAVAFDGDAVPSGDSDGPSVAYDPSRPARIRTGGSVDVAQVGDHEGV